MKSKQDHNINDNLNFSEELSKEFLREMKLKRRWGIFFKAAFLIPLVIIIVGQFIDFLIIRQTTFLVQLSGSLELMEL